MRLPCILLLSLAGAASAAPVSLFDGKSLDAWEGDTDKTWRVRDSAIVGGSLEGNPRNEFLATKKRYRNFHLRLEYKLVGTEGFVNGGVQFWSKRVENPPNEMSGFQADIGAGYSGCLYDESRRKKMLVTADKALITKLEKPGDWNTYDIVGVWPQVQLFVNGQRTAVWVEKDKSIARDGVVALQIHGNCKAEISFRSITIEEIPDSPVPPEFDVLSRFGIGQPKLPLPPFKDGKFEIGENETIVFVGQENFVRQQKSGALEAMLATAWADKKPRFRWMAWEADTVYEQWRELNFGSWAQQLETAGATVIIAQFGQMEALDGVERLTEFKAAYHRLLDEFATQTRRVVLISPMPFEKSAASHAPDLRQHNDSVMAYMRAIEQIASQRGAVFVDLFTGLALRDAARGAPRLTKNGIHLTPQGLEHIGSLITAKLGVASAAPSSTMGDAIAEKNRLWFDCWRPANWSFVYGDRVSQRFGRGSGGGPSLKESFEQRRPMIEALDARIHALAKGEEPPPINQPRQKAESPSPKALTPDEQLATFTMAEGYEVNLFASEALGLVKPIQFSWDEKGRLYVACSPTYPQTEALTKPRDYILVLEDTDNDGRADTSWRYAENLTMVQGVEPGGDGLYVCDFDQILYLRDTDGDGKADEREVLLSGFGIGDTHQLVNSITHGPDGSLWFSQGLHAMSRVETPWGIARLDRSAVWRYRPRTMRLEGFFGGGMAGANCWGVAFDDFGQVFHKSGDRPQGYWTVPGMVRGASPIGSGSTTVSSQSYARTPEQYHHVGALFDTSPKTTALDIVGTKALPDAIQGCALIGGYFGHVVELHRFHDDGAGFRTTQLPKLMRSSNNAFRPVDVSVGPDGAIYVADWYNPIIGHYQTSYSDPRRDKHHGRIWRITSKKHKSVVPPEFARMSNTDLLNQLKSPERWTRQQAKRLLFYRNSDEVLAAADAFSKTENEDRLLLELAGVYQAHETARPKLVEQLLGSADFRIRAYGTRVIGEWAHLLDAPLELLTRSVHDDHPRVRLEAAIAASYVPKVSAIEIVTGAHAKPRDRFLDYALRQSARALQPLWGTDENHLKHTYLGELAKSGPKRPSPAEDLYSKACLACHQPGGKGLPGVYPPLTNSDWVSGDSSRLIKIVLHGLAGPIEVNGKPFVAQAPVPMPPFAGLSDKEIAELLTYLRSQFGNKAEPISAEQVAEVRERTKDRAIPWTTDEFKVNQ